MDDTTKKSAGPATVSELPEPNEGPVTDRRTILKGAAAVSGFMAGFSGPTYLRDFNYTQTARAQASGPVKVGFIEDESGNLAVYGIQKLHAAQLAMKEINEGEPLKSFTE